MMLLQFLVCFRLFGAYTLGFHAVSILLHAAVVIILFMVSERLFKDRFSAFQAAAIFALHPIHTEPVAWISSVPDLQVSFFVLLTLWIFLGLPRSNLRSNLLAQLGMGICFALALLSKEIAVALALIATCYEHFYLEDRASTSPIQKFSRYGILWALDLSYLIVRTLVLRAFFPVGTGHGRAYVAVLPSVFALIGQYLWKFLWPLRLCAYYVFPDDLYDLLPRIGWGLVAVFLLILLFTILWRKVPLGSFGLLWFLAFLAPVLNIRWMPTNVFAERYLYLPSGGLCWVLALGFKHLFEMAAKRAHAFRVALVTCLAALAALCVVRIVTRNRDWQGDITFYTRTLAFSPNAFEMRTNLGSLYYNMGRAKDTEREWLEAQKSALTNVSVLIDPGLVYTDQGRYDDALAVLFKSLMLAPNSVETLVKLGWTYSQMGDPKHAESEYLAALALAPLSVPALNGLGELYHEEGRYQETVDRLTRSIQAVPTTDAYLRGGIVYWQLGQWDQAENWLKKAEDLDSGDSRAYFALGLFYDSRGRRPEALHEYQAGFKLDPDNQVARAAIQKLEATNPEPKPR